MKLLYRCSAGLDIHRDTVSACVRRRARGQAEATIEEEVFGTFTQELERLRCWLKQHHVRLPESHRGSVKFRMRAAYQMKHASDARQLLFRLHEELVELNPSAAANLVEGLEDTLTVIDLELDRKLRLSLSSTNTIESSFSVVERICHQVKRWHGSDHRLRWASSALLYAESRWHRIRGYRTLPRLITALEQAYQLRIRQTQSAASEAAA